MTALQTPTAVRPGVERIGVSALDGQAGWPGHADGRLRHAGDVGGHCVEPFWRNTARRNGIALGALIQEQSKCFGWRYGATATGREQCCNEHKQQSIHGYPLEVMA